MSCIQGDGRVNSDRVHYRVRVRLEGWGCLQSCKGTVWCAFVHRESISDAEHCTTTATIRTLAFLFPLLQSANTLFFTCWSDVHKKLTALLEVHPLFQKRPADPVSSLCKGFIQGNLFPRSDETGAILPAFARVYRTLEKMMSLPPPLHFESLAKKSGKFRVSQVVARKICCRFW